MGDTDKHPLKSAGAARLTGGRLLVRHLPCVHGLPSDMNNLRRMITTAVLLMVAGISFAQVDERARELLEGLAADAAVYEIRTMEQVMTTYMHQLGTSTTSRSIIDIENERAVGFTEPGGLVMRYVDRVLTMEAQGKEVPVSPELLQSFQGVFDQTYTFSVLDYEDATATYDGVVNYADVLTGHQVTYSGGMLQILAPLSVAETSEVRYIFDDAGHLAGTVSGSDGIHIVSVIVGEPVVNGLMLFNMELYEVENDVATPLATMSYETVSINEPVDETLFD